MFTNPRVLPLGISAYCRFSVGQHSPLTSRMPEVGRKNRYLLMSSLDENWILTEQTDLGAETKNRELRRTGLHFAASAWHSGLWGQPCRPGF